MTSPKKINPTDLLFLDGLRGLAALFVMMGHARLLVWEGFNEGYLKHPESYNAFNKMLVYFFSLFATKYGHQAVLFFFVLSGFLIHLKYASRLSADPNNKFDLGNYLVRRIRRIYPPLIFALLLTALLDYIGRSISAPTYDLRAASELPFYPHFTSNYNLKTFLGNLFFLNETYVPNFGSNGPLWSLKYEWWFYIFYPLFYLINRRSPLGSFGLMILLFILSFFRELVPVLLLRDIFSMMVCWWLGVLLADIYTGRVKIPFKYLAVFALLVPFYFATKLTPAWELNDLIFALGFFGLLSFFFWLKEKGYHLEALNKLKWLGDCSYTLYVIHFPLLMLMGVWIASHNGGRLPMSFAYMIAGMILSVILAHLFHFITEKPFLVKKKKIKVE
ncbi:MAG TPA: acyltransferase [Bacteroidia bacterium]|nr:acyltransferase [Bacteroidia bacterium]